MRKMRMLLIPLTLVGAIVAMVMVKRPGKLSRSRRKK